MTISLFGFRWGNVRRDNVVPRNVNTADANAPRRASPSKPGNSLFVRSNKGSLSPAGSPWTVALVAYLYAIGGPPLCLVDPFVAGSRVEITSEPPTGVFISRLFIARSRARLLRFG